MHAGHFWQGIGIGALAGTLLGIKLKSEEKHMKKTVNKAKRNMGNIMDSIGM